MNIVVGDKIVCIELAAGLYITDSVSGIGKTYLYKLIQAASALNPRLLAITYNGRTHNNDVVLNLLCSSAFDFVVLDRYDMYKSREILEAAQHLGCPVFLDYKGRIPLSFGGNWCEFELTGKGVRLYVDDN